MKGRIGKVLSFSWLVLALCSLIWMWNSYQAKGVDSSILESNSLVHVEQAKDFISFTPVRPYQKVFIFYPAALVDPEAYAPLCRRIADQGYKTMIIKMPWRLASYGYNKPIELGLLKDSTKQYILAGHSQGAKMAAQFVYEHPKLMSKLILIGTTHPKDIDLSRVLIPVMKIYGSKDGVANPDQVVLNKPKLPATTKYVLIAGANHAQFGYYGSQLRDHKATITREEQQKDVLEDILGFIKSE